MEKAVRTNVVRITMGRGFQINLNGVVLSVQFGCTGGQHRSVYCAEKLAGSLRTLYPGLVITVSHPMLNHK